MSITNVNVESVSSCRAGSAPETPKNRVKFMCSHGGKFLPRPADGRIKYVGGETRLICVPRDITFPELMMKLTTMFNGDRIILKYQFIPEDLDVLVTVKSDEDMRHMIEECDQFSSPRLRAFLFSSNPNKIQSMDHNSFERSYINSINGIIIHPSPTYNTYNTFKPLPVYTTHTTVTISTTCSSSRAPPETTVTCSITNPEVTVYHGKLSELPRHHSSPSLCDLSNHQNPVNHHHHPHQPPKPPLNRHPHTASTSENLGRMRSGSSSLGHL
ncbi:unnamed protein product [Lactuca saligna]|uniref:PB1 domain-containing protein n=1 Tax=Lactuca saligna TaxID=75948 RepID=A0AA36EFH5_LACSI|nr:unnamed protein product [Lactuca saligna]